MSKSRAEAESERRKRQSPRAYYLLGKVAPVMAEAQVKLGHNHPRTVQLTRIVEALFDYIDKGQDVSVETAHTLLNVVEE
jgi:hypothetical protein